jgi:hypothetical protein
MRMSLAMLTGLILLVFSLSSCNRNRYEVNISKVRIRLEIKRLEQDVFTLSPSELNGQIPHLKDKYAGFLQLFSYIINIGELNDPSWNDSFIRFCTDKLNNEVYTRTSEVFPDMKEIENGLTGAFRHYRYYFKGKKIPGIYTCISGFNNSIIVGDSILGIGLDRYLGSDSKYYTQLRIYNYQAAKMNPWNIVPDCIYAWGSSEWNIKEMNYKEDNVLSEMIHEGKLMYFVKCMLPESDENILFGFSVNQMKFCIEKEKQIWQYLIEENLLFKTEHLTIQKLIGEAPFTSYLSKESPGRAAVWIGFRIIESYMNINKRITLGELMKDTDYQSILENARYSP